MVGGIQQIWQCESRVRNCVVLDCLIQINHVIADVTDTALGFARRDVSCLGDTATTRDQVYLNFRTTSLFFFCSWGNFFFYHAGILRTTMTTTTTTAAEQQEATSSIYNQYLTIGRSSSFSVCFIFTNFSILLINTQPCHFYALYLLLC